MSGQQIPSTDAFPESEPSQGDLGTSTEQTTNSTPSKVAEPSDQREMFLPEDFAAFVHSYTREYIQLADQKAAAALALCAGMLGFLDSKNYLLDLFEVFQANWLVGVFQFLASLALMLGIAFSVLVILPRTSGATSGLVFFDSVANHKSKRQYAELVRSQNREALLSEILEHNHTLAVICQRKYSFLRGAMFASAAGLTLGLLLLLTRN